MMHRPSRILPGNAGVLGCNQYSRIPHRFADLQVTGMYLFNGMRYQMLYKDPLLD
jgi:hypothetical protein